MDSFREYQKRSKKKPPIHIGGHHLEIIAACADMWELWTNTNFQELEWKYIRVTDRDIAGTECTIKVRLHNILEAILGFCNENDYVLYSVAKWAQDHDKSGLAGEGALFSEVRMRVCPSGHNYANIMKNAAGLIREADQDKQASILCSLLYMVQDTMSILFESSIKELME